MEKPKSYDSAVQSNLDKCFNEKGKYIGDGYVDPDI